MARGESSSVRKATSIFRGKKKERSQPAKRAKLGLLEKHKDYVKRARDFNSKKRRLRALQARERGVLHYLFPACCCLPRPRARR